MQQYDSFSQIGAFGDALPGTVLTNTPVNNQQVIKPATVTTPNVVQGANIANKSADQVTLESDDGFYNVRVTGEGSAVSRVFEKLQSSMGAKLPAQSPTQAQSPAQAQGAGALKTTQDAMSAAKDAAVDAKVKAKEEELEKKKKAEEEKLATDKKKAL